MHTLVVPVQLELPLLRTVCTLIERFSAESDRLTALSILTNYSVLFLSTVRLFALFSNHTPVVTLLNHRWEDIAALVCVVEE